MTGTPGTTETLQNSQCSVDLSQTIATPSGNNLTLALPMTFKASYTGAKQVWMLAAGGADSSGFVYCRCRCGPGSHEARARSCTSQIVP